MFFNRVATTVERVELRSALQLRGMHRSKQRSRRGRNDGNDCDLRACNDRRIKEIPRTRQISIRLIYPWEDKVSWRSVVRLRYTQKRLPARHWKCDRHLIGTRYPVTRVTNFSVFYLGSAPFHPVASSPRSRPFDSPFDSHSPSPWARPHRGLVENSLEKGMKNCYLIYGHEIRPCRHVSRATNRRRNDECPPPIPLTRSSYVEGPFTERSLR